MESWIALPANKYVVCPRLCANNLTAASDLPTLCVAQGQPSVAHGLLPLLSFSSYFLVTSKLCPCVYTLHTPLPLQVALYSSVASGFHQWIQAQQTVSFLSR